MQNKSTYCAKKNGCALFYLMRMSFKCYYSRNKKYFSVQFLFGKKSVEQRKRYETFGKLCQQNKGRVFPSFLPVDIVCHSSTCGSAASWLHAQEVGVDLSHPVSEASSSFDGRTSVGGGAGR